MKEAYLISEVVLIKFAQILEVSRGVVTTGRFPVPAVTALLLRDPDWLKGNFVHHV